MRIIAIFLCWKGCKNCGNAPVAYSLRTYPFRAPEDASGRCSISYVSIGQSFVL